MPIGVLMIIFESRPDSTPQIAWLALASGNGLLLKGGKEAAFSNEAIHKVIGDAIEKGSGGNITRDSIALVTSRGQVADMLKLDDVVDLVIPSGRMRRERGRHTQINVTHHSCLSLICNVGSRSLGEWYSIDAQERKQNWYSIDAREREQP